MKEQMMISTSSEVIGSVDDLLIQILLRLPVKSLLRFKIVSKKWKSIIFSPCFSLQYDVGPKPAVGLFYHGQKSSAVDYIHFDVQNPRKPTFTELKFPEDPFPFWVHHSCNGLLLCCSYLNYDRNGESSISRFYVYNATINCFRKLPRPGVVNGVPKIVRGIYLAFDPAKSPSGKVVCVCVRESGDPDDNLLQIEIYSAESDEWRLSGDPFRSKAGFRDGVYWNGAIHWNNFFDDEVLFFSVDQEILGKISFPVDPNGSVLKNFCYFGESCDHLHLIVGTRLNVTVYEMKRDRSNWFVKYRVDLTAAVVAFTTCIYYPHIYSLIHGRNERPFLVLRISSTVIRFNLDSNTFEEVYKFEDDYDDDDVFPQRAYEYIESLRMF